MMEVRVEIIKYGSEDADGRPEEKSLTASREFKTRLEFWDAMDEIKMELAPKPKQAVKPIESEAIMILAPRWHDKTVLVADWKIQDTTKVEIISRDKYGVRQFPNPFYMDAKLLKSCPLETIGGNKFRAVPLDALKETA